MPGSTTGEEAFEGVQTLLNSLDGTLLNAHRIFQIDANFGVCSCVAEMLIQSHLKDESENYVIQLLPAIPAKWRTGSVSGLCARGGFVVDMDWEDGKNEISLGLCAPMEVFVNYNI